MFTTEDAKIILQEERKKYEKYASENLKLNMARGKPCREQLDLSTGLLRVLPDDVGETGIQDYRNYGILDGIPEAKKLFADLYQVDEKEIMVIGNSSLTLMYDTIQRGLQFGFGGEKPMNAQGKLKWLCPVPGYDRHFAITELFGFEMINIPMDENGPDMDLVEKWCQDPSVKGIWCVPKYSNPQGVVYSDETVERFAKLQPAAKDFRIYWDNAYGVHYLSEDVPLKNLLEEAKKYNNEDICYIFGSTSKISFAGAGLAFMISSEKNLTALKKLMGYQMIGPNKLVQLAHVLFFKNAEGIRLQMDKQAEILHPKFQKVLDILQESLSDLAKWTVPKGGYFISCDLPEGTAKKTVQLAAEVGVVFTGAGATFPYKKDPLDSNVRIAPTLPPLEELSKAMEICCCCAKIAWAERVLGL